MSDVYKFRLTVDLELATHQPAKDVRDFLQTYVSEEWALRQTAFPESFSWMMDEVLRFDVRAKRLDNDAPIGPDLTLRVTGPCPWCAKPLTDVVIYRLPFTCPHCRKVVRVDATGTGVQ